MQQFNVSKVIGTAFRIYIDNLIFFTVVFVIISIPTILILIYDDFIIASRIVLSGELIWLSSVLAVLLLSATIFLSIACEGVIKIVSRERLELTSSLSGGLSAVRHSFLTGLVVAVLIGTSVLVPLFVGFAISFAVPSLHIIITEPALHLIAILACAVPALLLGLRWFVAFHVAHVEGTGPWTAMSRSAFLTRGHRWAITAILITLLVVVFVTVSATGFIGHFARAAMGGDPSVGAGLIVGVFEAVVSTMVPATYFTIVSTLTYARLSAAKGNLDTERVIERF